MKNMQIILLVAGSCLVTFILSVIFSMNMVSIRPKQLAEVIKEDPVTFMEAIKEAAEKHQKESAKKALEKQFENPAKIDTKGRVTFGKASAPITIVEFSDFQCPYCARAAQSMRELKKKYEGKVKVVYKHYPLDFHPFAKPASEYFEAIALISHDQARKFHDEIFDNFSDYARLKTDKDINKSLKSLVKKLRLNAKEVEGNMKKAKEVVQKDIEEATKLGVRGTPSFYVNGVDPQGRIEMVIERFLGESKK